MRVSRIVLLLVALLAGGLAAFLAMRPGTAPPVPSPETKVIEEARAQILVAKQPIGMGERLSDANIEWQTWPEGAVRPEYVNIAATPEALTEMSGSVARFEFFQGEPIRTDKLIKTEQGYLSAVLDKGMRGISVPVQQESASGGFIVPNDHVDVILTRSTGSGDLSETILSNVRVLAINSRLGELGSTGGPDDPTSPRTQIFNGQAIATLELDPGQGETIINATSIGRLSLALRSIVDFASDGSPEGNQRNKPIKIIRGGQEATVTAGASVTPAAYDSTSPDSPAPASPDAPASP